VYDWALWDRALDACGRAGLVPVVDLLHFGLPNHDQRWPQLTSFITGPAGSIFIYTTDVIERGSAMTGTERSRFVLLADYAARGNPWMGKMSCAGDSPGVRDPARQHQPSRA